MPNKRTDASTSLYLTMQDLRHSYATILLSSGTNVKFVSEQLGHASTKMTLDRYFHFMPVHSSVVADDMQRILDDALGRANNVQYEQRAA